MVRGTVIEEGIMPTGRPRPVNAAGHPFEELVRHALLELLSTGIIRPMVPEKPTMCSQEHGEKCAASNSYLNSFE